MSEYQYYELRALDRPLDDRARHELRAISSRATITATSFVNEYTWGDLKADPAVLLARWFDALLHYTSWGTRWLAFRLPHGVLPAETLEPYARTLLFTREDGPHTSVHFLCEEEDPIAWDDEYPSLDELLPLREALASGDLRCLYLAWLLDLQRGDATDEELEPPVPPGLGALDPPHEAFGALMGLDEDLLEAAAEASAPLEPTAPSEAEIRAWLASLDRAEKDGWLLELLAGEERRVGWALRRRMVEALRPSAPAPAASRTGQALRERAEAIELVRVRREEQEQAEQRRLEAERRAAARKLHLDQLEADEPAQWERVHALLCTLRPKAYTEAVALVADLRDLADRRGDRRPWVARVRALRSTHHRKQTVVDRLDALLLAREA